MCHKLPKQLYSYQIEQRSGHMSFISFFKLSFRLIFFLSFSFLYSESVVTVGIDNLLCQPEYRDILNGKKIGLITNHTALNGQRQTTIELLKNQAKSKNYEIKALFAPEHGIKGVQYASESVKDEKDLDGIPVYSLHGKTRRPTLDMLMGLDMLIYDIQDIGSRSYTYISTLFYVMEEAAKMGLTVVVLDRPNPINGITVDGPMLEDKWRSFVGYVNVPYCHGMTVGELALFFNREYKINCPLLVIPMKGWKRTMSFNETGLSWMPTSPHIPEATTAFYYPTTGILGELQIVNIGVGYTLPFKLIGAPWIQAEPFAKALNAQNFPGVYFQPFYYRPFFGKFTQENCQGVLIVITDPKKYQPVTTQYLIIGILKSLYPIQFQQGIEKVAHRVDMFNKVNGTEEVYRIIREEKYVTWQLKELHSKQRKQFLKQRLLYLIPTYD